MNTGARWQGTGHSQNQCVFFDQDFRVLVLGGVLALASSTLGTFGIF